MRGKACANTTNPGERPALTGSALALSRSQVSVDGGETEATGGSVPVRVHKFGEKKWSWYACDATSPLGKGAHHDHEQA